MAGVKGRSGGARRGAGRKRRLDVPAFSAISNLSAESAGDILLRVCKEEQIVAALNDARKSDLWLWWAMVKELMHQAYGKPSPAHMFRSPTLVEPEPLSPADVDRKIMELLRESDLERLKSGNR